MDLYIQICILIFIIGLIFGSFFNVCILRPFSNETLTNPKRSKCMSCNHPLAWYDNIPLLSYIILLGKCRYCKARISWQYPLVELITAILFLCTYLKFGHTWQCLGMLVAISFFIIMSGTDFIDQVVFDRHTYPFIILGVIYGISTGDYLGTALGVFVGAGIMELVARSGYLFVKQRAFGEGDTYIAAGIGAFLGVKGIILTMLFAVLIQSVWAFPALIAKYIKNKKYSETLTMFVFIYIVVNFLLLNHFKFFDSSIWVYIAFVLLIFEYTFKVCMELINSTKLEGGLSLPFGPALFMGGLIYIFLSEQIIVLLKQVEWISPYL